MGFKVFTSTTLSSADVNNYLMKQAVIVCTSGTRPSSPNAGMTIFETDTGLRKTYSGVAWIGDGERTAYTPAWTSTGAAPALGNGTAVGFYSQLGNMVNFVAKLTAGSTSTFGSGTYELSLPVAKNASVPMIGAAYGRDGGVSSYAMAVADGSSATTCQLIVHAVNANWNATNPWTFANGDWVAISGTYWT